jgi:hypothetical protein
MSIQTTCWLVNRTIRWTVIFFEKSIKGKCATCYSSLFLVSVLTDGGRTDFSSRKYSRNVWKCSFRIILNSITNTTDDGAVLISTLVFITTSYSQSVCRSNLEADNIKNNQLKWVIQWQWWRMSAAAGTRQEVITTGTREQWRDTCHCQANWRNSRVDPLVVQGCSCLATFFLEQLYFIDSFPMIVTVEAIEKKTDHRHHTQTRSSIAGIPGGMRMSPGHQVWNEKSKHTAAFWC